jgi:hypothetical protein
MLKKPIEEGASYCAKDGHVHGPMKAKGSIFVDHAGYHFYENGFPVSLPDSMALVSRVKTAKADKPKKPKWRDAWVVVTDTDQRIYFADKLIGPPQVIDGNGKVHRARVRIKPEAPDASN